LFWSTRTKWRRKINHHRNTGEILYKGKKLGKQFRTEVGIQFQTTSLQEFLTVADTLRLFYSLYPNPMNWDELVDLCDLRALLKRDNQSLSGGQRQRLLLALALVNDPEILFFDEPTTGLDPQARHNFWNLIKLIRTRNKSIVITTHYMDEAYELCDEIAIIDKGNIIAQGTPKELLKHYFGETIIQLPEKALSTDKAKTLNLRYTINDDWIDIQTEDPHQTLNTLFSANVSLSQLRTRESSLEDLFIVLTTPISN